MYSGLVNLVNGITQNYFGEAAVYKSGATETNVKAIFEMQWIELNGVSTKGLTCQIRAGDIPSEPKKNDQVIRGAKTYTVSVAQQDGDGSIYTLILKD